MKCITTRALAALCACCFSIAVSAAEPDIIGLTLGMSPAQAKSALVEFGVDPGRIQENMSSYRYYDGISGHDTDEFLNYIVADKVERKNGMLIIDNFKLVFAPPPKGGQLVMVRRQIDNPVDPPSAGEYRAAILEKYGKPSEDRSGSLLWLDPGNAVNCTNNAPQDVTGIISSIYMGSEKQGWRLHQLRNANKVREPSQCARMLQYKMPSLATQPAKRVIAVMTDVPGWGNAYLATLEWIEAQRQAAVKAREGGASKPRL